MPPVPDPHPTSTYLVVLADDVAPPVADVVRRLVARGHRVVVRYGVGRTHSVPPAAALAGRAADTSAAIGELRPDAVLVAGPDLGALVAAERSTVPLGLLQDGAAPVPARRVERAWRPLLPALDEVRAAHGLGPLRRVTDQLHRVDLAIGPDSAAEAVVDALEALPRCRPWLLVARHAPVRSADGAPQLVA